MLEIVEEEIYKAHIRETLAALKSIGPFRFNVQTLRSQAILQMKLFMTIQVVTLIYLPYTCITSSINKNEN